MNHGKILWNSNKWMQVFDVQKECLKVIKINAGNWEQIICIQNVLLNQL